MDDLFPFARDVLQCILLALRMDDDAVQVVDSYPNTGWIVFTIAVLAGASTLFGQSVVLFLNRVRPARFVISLVLSGLVLALSLLAWGVVIWLLGRLLLDTAPTIGLTLVMVGLSTAPFVFGTVALVPYLGDVLSRCLYVWSLLIAVRAVELTFGGSFLEAVAVVGVGFLLLLVVTKTVGRRVVAVRNRVWSRVLGRDQRYASARDLLTAYAAAPPADEAGRPGR